MFRSGIIYIVRRWISKPKLTFFNPVPLRFEGFRRTYSAFTANSLGFNNLQGIT